MPTTHGARNRTNPDVEVEPSAADAVRHGHPWIWRTSVRRAPKGLVSGAVVALRDPERRFIGWGLWDCDSPIASRVYSMRSDTPVDLGLLSALVLRAVESRGRWFDPSTTNAYRLCNGEGDRVPGVVMDRYDRVAVAKFDGAAIQAWAGELLPALWPRLRERGVASLALREGERGSPTVRVWEGEPLPDRTVVTEHGMRLVVDLKRGQKTGAYLDQRENRRRVRGLAHGTRALNLFSYTGGFSVSMALGGARHVTSVDIAHPALALAQESFRANGLDAAGHSFVTADVFDFLASAQKKGDRYDLIVCDPPSFAPSERSVARALASYRKLHAGCARVLGPGGILCAASCSSHVTPEMFLATLDDVALGRPELRVWESYGLPKDHPTTAAWAEGRYLKFVVVADGAVSRSAASGESE